jgi:RND family efflux transporter MFP subunit
MNLMISPVLTKLKWGAVLMLAACCLSGCGTSAPAKEVKKPKVIVTTPITDTVMDYQDFTGRLEAVKTIDIRARVSGYVTEIPFKEGDVVTEGDLLFQIDKRPYQADLNQAEANLKVSLADSELQKKNAERAKELLPVKAISKEDYETVLATKDKSLATVGAMEAARDRAKLYLDYTKVTAPVTGRISRRFVDHGNLINADMTVLTTIVTENPMYAYFDVDERTYLTLLEQVSPGTKALTKDLKQPVLMSLANDKEFKRVGYVDFVDNRVIATSGTVRMRGVFENTSGLLKAGLFVRIRLPISAPYQALLIPDEAIINDQERKYVWVVGANDEVEYRSIEVGQALRDLRVLVPPAKGKNSLTEGDRIIVSGMQRVRKGATVIVENQAPPAPPEQPLVRLLAKPRGD